MRCIVARRESRSRRTRQIDPLSLSAVLTLEYVSVAVVPVPFAPAVETRSMSSPCYGSLTNARSGGTLETESGGTRREEGGGARGCCGNDENDDEEAVFALALGITDLTVVFIKEHLKKTAPTKDRTTWTSAPSVTWAGSLRTTSSASAWPRS